MTPTEPKNEYIFDPEKFRDAVVMPWYRNQDTPQVCNLTILTFDCLGSFFFNNIEKIY